MAVEQEAPAESPADFRPAVPADDAPAADAEPDAVPSDDPPADTESVVEEAAQVNPFEVTREFRRHVVTGEIVAVELVGGQLQGARLCTRPVEQDAGALPVMLLEDRESDVAKWYRKNALDFRPWEAPAPPRMLMDRLRSLYEQAVEARAAYDKAKSAAKFAKDRVEEVDTAIFHALRRIHDVPDGQAELPLAPPDQAAPAEPALPLEDVEDVVNAAEAEADDAAEDISDEDEAALKEQFDVTDTEDRDERLAAEE